MAHEQSYLSLDAQAVGAYAVITSRVNEIRAHERDKVQISQRLMQSLSYLLIIYMLTSNVHGEEFTETASHFTSQAILVPGSPNDGIPSLLVDTTEVSEAQILQLLSNPEPSTLLDPRRQRPATTLSRAEAGDYCARLGKRLPTEAEWEWIARSGRKRLGNPWTDPMDACEFAVLADPVEGTGCGYREPWPVVSMSRGATVQGVFHMAGNVAEWTSSDVDELAVVRGGSFWTSADEGGIFHRRQVGPTFDRNFPNDIGFRCVAEVKGKE